MKFDKKKKKKKKKKKTDFHTKNQLVHPKNHNYEMSCHDK